MQIGDWAATPDLNQIYREIRELGLETNLAELGAFGFTTIEGALSADEVAATRAKVIAEISEARLGRKLDLDGEADYEDLSFIPFLLFKDPIFKIGLLNPAARADHLSAGPALHSLQPRPAPERSRRATGSAALRHRQQHARPTTPYAQVANCNYALTDYTEARGCLGYCARQPSQPAPADALEVGLEGRSAQRRRDLDRGPGRDGDRLARQYLARVVPAQGPVCVNLSCYLPRGVPAAAGGLQPQRARRIPTASVIRN